MIDKTLTGYASVFYAGSPETEFQLAPSVMERVSPHAFDRSLKENPDVFALVAHDAGRPIGRTTGEPASLYLTVDRRGLLASILPVDASDGRDAIALVESRVLRGMSFAFQCLRDEWTPGPNGSAIRELQDLELLEVSIVTWPAYKGTTIAISTAKRGLTHSLGKIARRAQLVYEPRLSTYKAPRMNLEHADETRNADQLLAQSRLRLYDRRAKMIAARERLHLLPSHEAKQRDAELAAELIDIVRAERNLIQICGGK